jgi:AcrR family transcriptional regulator
MSPRRAKAISGRVSGDPATALRDHLIATAEKLLAERHVSAITTRDIARAAGVSDGVLYNYFSDKNDLLLAALARRFSGLVARFDADLPESGTASVEENLIAYARAMLELNTGTLPLMAGLLIEPPLLQRFHEVIHSEPFGPQLYPQRLAKYLTDEQRIGRLPYVDVDAVTTLIIGATVTLALSGLLQGLSHGDLAKQLPAIVRTIVRGLNPS